MIGSPVEQDIKYDLGDVVHAIRELTAAITARPVTEPLDPVDELNLEFQRYKRDADARMTDMLARHMALWERMDAHEAAEKAFVLVTGNADLIANVVANLEAAGDLS